MFNDVAGGQTTSLIEYMQLSINIDLSARQDAIIYRDSKSMAVRDNIMLAYKENSHQH